MPPLLQGESVLTELDHARLSRLPAAATSEALQRLLESAELVPSREVPADVVTMYSQLWVLDVDSGERRKLTLCYPADAEPQAGFISACSPVGLALLGARVGATVLGEAPGGRRRPMRIEALLFQPEASGDYLT